MKKLVVTPEGTFEVELTAQEILQKEQEAIKSEQDTLDRLAKEEQEKLNKQSALNKLKALGLNDAEINSILGK
jgi:hypothetical protein